MLPIYMKDLRTTCYKLCILFDHVFMFANIALLHRHVTRLFMKILSAFNMIIW